MNSISIFRHYNNFFLNNNIKLFFFKLNLVLICIGLNAFSAGGIILHHLYHLWALIIFTWNFVKNYFRFWTDCLVFHENHQILGTSSSLRPWRSPSMTGGRALKCRRPDRSSLPPANSALFHAPIYLHLLSLTIYNFLFSPNVCWCILVLPP